MNQQNPLARALRDRRINGPSWFAHQAWRREVFLTTPQKWRLWIGGEQTPTTRTMTGAEACEENFKAFSAYLSALEDGAKGLRIEAWKREPKEKLT